VLCVLCVLCMLCVMCMLCVLCTLRAAARSLVLPLPVAQAAATHLIWPAAALAIRGVARAHLIALAPLR
jgi:hypothetical protein